MAGISAWGSDGPAAPRSAPSASRADGTTRHARVADLAAPAVKPRSRSSLISSHLVGTIDDLVEYELVGELPLKGFQRPWFGLHGAPQALSVGGASRAGRAHLRLLDDLVGAQQHRGSESKGFSFPAAPGRRTKREKRARGLGSVIFT